MSTLPLYAIGVLDRSDEEAGLLMTIFLLSAIVVRPFTGKLLDIVGKRKMLWIGLFFYLACTVLYYFVVHFGILLALRFFHGIWFSIITTAAISLVADIVPTKRRGTGIGYFTMSTNLAVVLGPFIGLLLIQRYSFEVLFIVMSVMMVIGGIVSLLLPEGIRPQKKEVVKRFSMNDLFEKKAIPVALIGCFIAFSYASILSYLSIYAEGKGLLSFTSSFFFVFAAVMLLTRPITGRIFDEKGPKYILIPGFSAFILGLVLLAFMDSIVMFFIAGGVIGFGYGTLVPSLQTMAVQSTKHERSGYATATFFTLFDVGVASGSYVLGLIALHSTYRNVYLFSGLIVLIVFLCYLFLMKGNAKNEVLKEI